MTERVLGSASCAYWADMQLYRTTGSVQQEQESSPLTSKAEHTGPLSTGGSIVGTTSNLRKCIKIQRRFSVLACTSVGYGLLNPDQKLCNVPAYIYLSVLGCWLQTEMTGSWHPTVYGCPAIPSSSGAAEGTLQSLSRRPRALNYSEESGLVRCARAAGVWINTGGSSFVVRPNVDHVREALLDIKKSRGIFFWRNTLHLAEVLRCCVFLRFCPCQTEFTGCLFSLEPRTGSRV